ncbi:putative Amicyanin precursor [Pandoraea cepalis]|uniref:Putative Amicyanin n=1 Tax=Pandoraea cepalis TaxID=2508294 RepID=A0A5E4TWV8_9BURK|nr:putative Amicyanin precursor [Pandoraea cepalis]
MGGPGWPLDGSTRRSEGARHNRLPRATRRGACRVAGPSQATLIISRAFALGALDTNGTFSFMFDKPVTYPYYCAIHPHMTGVILVKSSRNHRGERQM